ncbi:MAG: hypothetical protein HIU91_12850 [Acidobacteria bacterium]|nr:hypothetical protein [Acidobacteriota bacterium]
MIAVAASVCIAVMTACGGGWGDHPEVVRGPASQTVIAGQTATFSVTADGTAPLSYQWSENGVALKGANGASYTTPATTGTDNGAVFSVTVTNAVGGASSASAMLTVELPPAIVTPPANQVVTAGQMTTFTVGATGTGPLAYQWYRNGVAIPGATGASYSTMTSGNDNGAIFTAVVTNMAGTVTTYTATLTVNVPPTITLQPVSDTVDAGRTATYRAAATGTAPITYQWYRSGVAIPGATGSAYTTAATVSGDSGASFTVVAANVAGTVSSAAAGLTVNVGPTFTLQPQSQTITAGQTATLSAAVTGTGPITYQWYLNGAAIGGATANFYTTPALAGTNSGSAYTVTATNVAGSTTSVAAVLTVNVVPTIAVQPVAQTVTVGQPAVFSVAATGTGPLTYQWYRSGGVIAGATQSSYTTAATSSEDSGATFSVIVSNAAGSVTSVVAGLTVNTPPSITIQPTAATVTLGQPATFFTAATGTAPLNYQWYDGGVAIAGATSRYYTTAATVSGSNGSAYTVVVTNAAGSVTSAVATLSVNSPPVITLQPNSQTATAGQTASFTVAATGTAPLSYQWFRNGAAISGATASAYTTPATVSGDSGALFTVTVTNAAGTVTSVAATLTVNSPPTITMQPMSETVTVPQTASFSVIVTGTAPLGYQWYKNGAAIGGATASSYTTPATATSSSVPVYTVTVTNGVGSVTSVAADLTVNNSPLANNTLVCGSVTPPFGATITVVPNFSGGTGVIGTNGYGSSNVTTSALSGSSYTSTAITTATTFTLTVTGSGGAATVNSCTATPTPVTITPITPAAQTMAPGSQTFGATAVGGATNTLTWTATGGSFSGNVWTAPSAPGSYTITATSVDDPAVHVTTTATVTVPVITAQPISKNACSGYSPSLSIGANYATGYQWSFNGGVVGGDASTLTLSDVTTSSNGSYSCMVSNAAGSVTSNTVTLKVVNPTTLTITTQPTSLSVYATQTATFSVAASGTGTLKYQWYQGAVGSGAAINGATSSTYTTPALAVGSSGTSYYVTVTDPDCTSTTVTSTAATVTVSGADTAVPPTIIVQPSGVTTPVAGSPTFSVSATGGGTISYQWYRVPYSSTELTNPTAGSEISGATATTYVVPAAYATQSNDGDAYFVVVTNAYGTAVSSRAVLAVGAGIVLQINAEPQTDYVAVDTLASFTTSATCTGCIPAYQWYWYAPGATTASPLTDQTVSSGVLSGATISGSLTSSLTLENVPASASGALLYVVVTSTSDGTTQISGTNPLTSTTAGLFVGTLNTVGASTPGSGLCDSNTVNWVLNGNNPGTAAGDVPYQNTTACTMQLTNDQGGEHSAVYWPTLISTAKFSVSFTVALTATNGTPADGFTMVLADPSQGATTASLGATGQGLGADGIPGFVLGFDTYQNGDKQADPGCGSCDPVPVPYMAVGQGASSLWENPWTFVNGELDTQNSTDYTPSQFANATHSYVVTVVNSIMTVTMDGNELFTGTVTLPPNAYLGFTASTGGAMESVTFSNLTATISAP